MHVRAAESNSQDGGRKEGGSVKPYSQLHCFTKAGKSIPEEQTALANAERIEGTHSINTLLKMTGLVEGAPADDRR